MTTADLTQSQLLRRLTLADDSDGESIEELKLHSNFSRGKTISDRILGLLLLIPALPLIGLLIVLIRVTSRGPGVFRQTRVGKKGRIFTMYKLRSMRLDAELGTGPVWANAEDLRVTLVGHWLRRLHLDELPQLFNVIRGEMSLVGPRPERPEFVAVLAEQIPGYLNRLAVLPGITGLAQINLPADTDLDSVRRKLALDNEYICTSSPWLEFRIIVCTLLRLIGLRGGIGVRLLGLQRVVNLSTSAASVGGETVVPVFSQSFAAAEAPKMRPLGSGARVGDLCEDAAN
jgi:lipopolysaccharide/colanic/teichoic acid biosynthesis glycosyltransferase